MKVTIEIYETAKRKPTSKDAMVDRVGAFHRSFREWSSPLRQSVIVWPEHYPLWFSLRDLPKPEPLRKRKAKEMTAKEQADALQRSEARAWPATRKARG